MAEAEDEANEEIQNEFDDDDEEDEDYETEDSEADSLSSDEDDEYDMLEDHQIAQIHEYHTEEGPGGNPGGAGGYYITVTEVPGMTEEERHAYQTYVQHSFIAVIEDIEVDANDLTMRRLSLVKKAQIIDLVQARVRLQMPPSESMSGAMLAQIQDREYGDAPLHRRETVTKMNGLHVPRLLPHKPRYPWRTHGKMRRRAELDQHPLLL